MTILPLAKTPLSWSAAQPSSISFLSKGFSHGSLPSSRHKSGNSSSLHRSIKYPNDLFVDGYKIAGILVHLKEDHVLISFGLNVNMLDAAIDQPWTSLRRLTGTRHNRGLLLDHLAHELTQQLHLKTLDFKTLNSYDMCMNKPVYITKSPEEIGIGKGFISRGTYLIQFPRGLYELAPNDRLRILT